MAIFLIFEISASGIDLAVVDEGDIAEQSKRKKKNIDTYFFMVGFFERVLNLIVRLYLFKSGGAKPNFAKKP
ncbi:uncharacterized protein METZ01_LOCUS95407 [marine metagenome]|uniref:Uncharacterized protein n=1 Tax=marine metagenome TaxID=408172 RepID=A0A381VSL9_9ZZZZ